MVSLLWQKAEVIWLTWFLAVLMERSFSGICRRDSQCFSWTHIRDLWGVFLLLEITLFLLTQFLYRRAMTRKYAFGRWMAWRSNSKTKRDSHHLRLFSKIIHHKPLMLASISYLIAITVGLMIYSPQVVLSCKYGTMSALFQSNLSKHGQLTLWQNVNLIRVRRTSLQVFVLTGA